MLAWVTARIRLEPLFAAETFFAAMLGLHPAIFNHGFMAFTLDMGRAAGIFSAHRKPHLCLKPPDGQKTCGTTVQRIFYFLSPPHYPYAGRIIYRPLKVRSNNG
jgi:hypothetical protein